MIYSQQTVFIIVIPVAQSFYAKLYLFSGLLVWEHWKRR